MALLEIVPGSPLATALGIGGFRPPLSYSPARSMLVTEALLFLGQALSSRCRFLLLSGMQEYLGAIQHQAGQPKCRPYGSDFYSVCSASLQDPVGFSCGLHLPRFPLFPPPQCSPPPPALVTDAVVQLPCGNLFPPIGGTTATL